MADTADDKSSLGATSFLYYLNATKPKKPLLASSNLSNSNTSNTDHLGRVDSFSHVNSVGAPTRGGVFGSDTKRDLKNVEIPAAAAAQSSSSCNSQTALIMPILQRNGSQARQKKAINGRGRRRGMFLGFGCSRGACFDKKDVHINHHHLPARAQSQRIDHHHIQQQEEDEVEMYLEESRKSIEVFGSGAAATVKGAVAKNMERKLSMLTWDAIIPIPKVAQNSSIMDIIPTASRNGDDDVASEASSDLFEIENISRGRGMAADDDASSYSFCTTTPASRYAPSEASIQRSAVTTADYNDDAAVSVATAGKEAQKRLRYGGVLGCRSQKAVDTVAQNVAS